MHISEPIETGGGNKTLIYELRKRRRVMIPICSSVKRRPMNAMAKRPGSLHFPE